MKLCVITGEASGDLHTAALVRELRRLDPDLRAFGIGGSHLEDEGVELLFHVKDLAIVGLFNVIRHIPMYRKVFRETLEAIDREKPDAVLLVDFPDFNLRLARQVSDRGFRVFYYISPQIWAWRQRRVRHVAKFVDHMLVIFPFEERFFRDAGVPVTYVGHPLIDRLEAIETKRLTVTPDLPVRIALLPGSRRSEVDDLFPPMLDAVTAIQRERKVEAFVIKAPTIHRDQLATLLDPHPAEVEIVESEGYETLSTAHAAMASSGTATLEAAILGIPVVVMYRLTTLTYLLAIRLVKLEHFSLVNIVAGRKVVPELLQREVTGARIASEMLTLLDPANHDRVVKDLASVREALGHPGASRRAAETVFKLAKRSDENQI